MYFSQSGDQKPESKVPCWLGSEACAFPGLKIADFSLYPHVVGELSSLTSLLIRAFTPFLRASSSRFRSLPKASLPNAITLGIRLQPVNFVWTQAFNPWQPEGRRCQITVGLGSHAIEDELYHGTTDRSYFCFRNTTSWGKSSGGFQKMASFAV